MESYKGLAGFQMLTGRQLLGGALALGFILLGASVAQAATYNFTYTGNGSSAYGTIVFDGTNVTSASGTVSFAGDPNGSGSIGSVLFNYGSFYNSPTNYLFDFRANVGTHPDRIDFYLTAGANNSSLSDNNNNAFSSGTATAAPAPAPIPGGGPLSFLALGIAGLAFRRKQIAGFVGASFRRLSNKPVVM